MINLDLTILLGGCLKKNKKHMDANHREKLIVISVPYIRLAKYFLSSKIYNQLKQECKVLIVGPMCGSEAFQKEFGDRNVCFLEFYDERFDSKLLSILYNVSEGLRRFGYYKKIRHKLGIYWSDHIQKKRRDLTKNGENKKNTHIYRYSAYVLGSLGRWNFLWKFFDFIIHFFYKHDEYLKAIKGKKTIVLHSANWGFQERILSYYSRSFNFKTIFIPYTSDQIAINGNFMVEHDVFLSQGSVETDFLVNSHGVRKERISKFGMIWRRNLESTIVMPPDVCKYKVIMYAGLSEEFYPFESELDSVDYLIDRIERGYFGNTKLIYRPDVLSERQRKIVIQKYSKKNYMKFQFISNNIAGLTGGYDGSESVKRSIEKYVEEIRNSDILVTSGPISLGMDAIHFNIPWIMNFSDKSRVLYNGEALFSQGGKSNCTPEHVLKLDIGVPYAKTLFDMAELIKSNLKCSADLVKKQKEIYKYWDYENDSYIEDFMKIVNIEKSS